MSFQSEPPLGTEIELGTTASITDTDNVPFETTGVALSKKITWLSIKATLKTYFDTFYQAILTAANFGTFISGLIGKTTPVDADGLAIYDSVASNVAKSLTFANLKTWIGSFNLSWVANVLTSRNNLALFDMYITTGDQTTTSNVATNITGLVTGTLEANKRYYFEGIIHIGCNNTGGVKIQATLPTGATVFFSTLGFTSSSSTHTSGNIIASATLGTSYCTLSNTVGYIRIAGEVQMSSNTGTAQFGVASGTNTQTSTVYQLGTCVSYKKIN